MTSKKGSILYFYSQKPAFIQTGFYPDRLLSRPAFIQTGFYLVGENLIRLFLTRLLCPPSILITKGISWILLARRATFMTSLMSLERSSFQTFATMLRAKHSSMFSFVSLDIDISENSSKVYSGTSKTANLDNRG